MACRDTSKKIHNILDLVGGMLACVAAGAGGGRCEATPLSSFPHRCCSYPESILGHPLRDDLAGQLKSDKARFIKVRAGGDVRPGTRSGGVASRLVRDEPCVCASIPDSVSAR